VKAAIDAGLPANDDFNGPEQDGVGLYQLTQRNGMRWSTAVGYLHPALDRPNLTVASFMHATRVFFEGTRAVGVAAQRLDEVHEFRAAREVILCGGAYNTPQLLMLSGVGPAEHLEMREVEVLADMPAVGENLSDHCMVSTVWTSTEPVSLLLALEPAALEEFNERATGPLTSNLAEAGGFARSRPELEAPDLQFFAAPVQIPDEGTADPLDHGMWMAPCILQPESRGSVRLASNDPTAKPIIRHNYYAAEADMQAQMAGMRMLLDIVGRPALRPYCAEPFLAPDDMSEEALRGFIARNTVTVYHPVGTCAIGSVVDPELSVMGLEGLRVVDASVMPMVPRGNTNAPTIAVAERAADLIRGVEPAALTARTHSSPAAPAGSARG
jgi:choline dehydrogenase